MTQTKIHIQDGDSGVGEESAQRSKEKEIKQVCVSQYLHCHDGYYTSDVCL